MCIKYDVKILTWDHFFSFFLSNHGIDIIVCLAKFSKSMGVIFSDYVFFFHLKVTIQSKKNLSCTRIIFFFQGGINTLAINTEFLAPITI